MKACKLSTIRRYAARMWKLVDAYAQGLDGALACYAMKRYSGHRRIPQFLGAQIDQMQRAIQKGEDPRPTKKPRQETP